jgi:hypothetical protein
LKQLLFGSYSETGKRKGKVVVDDWPVGRSVRPTLLGAFNDAVVQWNATAVAARIHGSSTPSAELASCQKRMETKEAFVDNIRVPEPFCG